MHEDTYIVEYALEYGFLRMTPKTRSRLNLTVMLVVLGKYYNCTESRVSHLLAGYPVSHLYDMTYFCSLLSPYMVILMAINGIFAVLCMRLVLSFWIFFMTGPKFRKSLPNSVFLISVM